MQFSFKETKHITPTLWFELHADHMPLKVFYPTKGLCDYVTSDFATMYGLDVEAEASLELYNNLVINWECLDFLTTDKQRIRFELSLAIDAIKSRLCEKFKAIPTNSSTAAQYDRAMKELIKK